MLCGPVLQTDYILELPELRIHGQFRIAHPAVFCDILSGELPPGGPVTVYPAVSFAPEKKPCILFPEFFLRKTAALVRIGTRDAVPEHLLPSAVSEKLSAAVYYFTIISKKASSRRDGTAAFPVRCGFR